MDLIYILMLATISVLCALTFALRLVGWSQLLAAHWLADVLFTVALFLIFSGTLTGSLVAAFGGLMFSLILTAGRVARRHAQKLKRRNRARAWLAGA